MTSGDPPSTAKDRIETVLNEFCEAWFAGICPDPDSFCRDHPECEPELGQRIASFLDAARSFSRSEDGDGSADREANHDDDDLQGRILGDFRIMDEIGRGGMARVYEAEQISLKRRVALKVLSPHLSFSTQAVQKFHREAEAGSRQSHAGIVSVYAVGSIRGTHYIVQELVAGARTLADHLERLGKEPALPRGHFRQAAEKIADVARAVAHAHRSGVIHRDLKPSNILLTRKDEPKVTDFGLARVEGALALSQSGDFAGTPYYMSPEQARGSRSAIDRRTDIYSLGVTFYEALTLNRPFDGDTSHEVIKKILLLEPKDPRKINARVPRDLSVICLKAMEKEPSKRYQSMEELAEDLDRFLEGEPILARPSRWISRPVKWVRRHKLLSVAAGTLFVALATVAVLLLVIFLEQRDTQKRAREKFKPVQEALGWSSAFLHSSAQTWCMMTTPDDPDPYIMKGLLEIELGNFEKAIVSLEIGREKLQTDKHVTLDTEARHLLAVAKFRYAQLYHVTARKRQDLIDEALRLLPPGDNFDCTSPDAFIFRDRDGGTGNSGEQQFLLRPIEVNTDHYMIHLYRGMLVFDRVYKGGEWLKYSKAIESYKDVLEKQPHNAVALSYLGRIYYFMARFYNLMPLTREALELLEKARERLSSKPYHMIDTTIGQIHVLLGNNQEARDHFEKAFKLAGDCSHIHNSLRGLGKVFVRLGDFESAGLYFNKALDLKEFDYHNNIAAAEYYFYRGEIDTAFKHALRSCEDFHQSVMIKTPIKSDVAAANLICARLYVTKGDFEQVFLYLDKVYDTPHVSPRDLSLACFLIVGIIDEATNSPEERDNVVRLARHAAQEAIRNAHFGELRSPISLAATGVAHYLCEEYAESIDSLKQALKERKKWPEDARRFYWVDNARDLYLLAMVHRKLALNERNSNGDSEQEARKYFRQAQELWANNDLPYEYVDINKMIRRRAREVMGDH
jgi:tetratricopeptide (TPR) repeat protein/tRNA A-37 threonylcarbamoyl transferase component Bud32